MFQIMFQNKIKFYYETKPKPQIYMTQLLNNKFETNPFALYIFLKTDKFSHVYLQKDKEDL